MQITKSFLFYNYRNTIGRATNGVVAKARSERRLISGLLEAIIYLEENPLDALLCILPETRPGDAASHMHTVLLQAFCYENCIPVIQVNIFINYLLFNVKLAYHRKITSRFLL